jgi:hypothetical protein
MGENHWTPEVIARRQQVLIARASQIWGLDATSIAAQATPRRLQRALREALSG